MLDETVLWLQSLVDRLARWARLRLSPPPQARRFLIVQIDGLPRAVLEEALASGRAPALRRLMATGRLRWRPLAVGLPTSTPAFQAALMYGVRPDIPGFHYYDKRAGADRYFPRRGVADLVEERLARGRRGIMEHGACYGCVFTGGAADSLWTFARLLSPTRAGLLLLRAPLSAVLLSWVIAKCLLLTTTELGRAILRLVADPVAEAGRGFKWLAFKIGLSIWTRQLFTLAVSGELYRGTPAVYVNYLEYDVFAHAFGPRHRLALRALRRIDRSVAQLARIVRRLPERGYDLYVLSDHGQAATTPFVRVSRGSSIEATVLATLAAHALPPVPAPLRAGGDLESREGYFRLFHRTHIPGLFQRFLTYLERDFPSWLGAGDAPERLPGVRVIAAGPNAFVYFMDRRDALLAEEIERRYPGAVEALSRHPGIGLVLARSADGPVCWHRGGRTSLGLAARGGPFAQRPDREIVLRGLHELMAMPSAGDLVLYGIGASAGDVSFLDERGAHAGPSEAELHTFLLHPPAVALADELLAHPILLYSHFAGYRDESPA